MKEFSYRAKLGQDLYTGSVNAVDEASARKQLERMSYTDISLSDVAVDQERLVLSRQAPPSPPDQRLTNMVENYRKDVENQISPSPGVQPVSDRKECVVVGEKSILKEVNVLLESKRGRVSKALMHPDHQGKMHYLFVVEHDA